MVDTPLFLASLWVCVTDTSTQAPGLPAQTNSKSPLGKRPEAVGKKNSALDNWLQAVMDVNCV